MNRHLVALCIALVTGSGLLSACGGSGSDGTSRYDVNYEALRWADPALSPLTNAHSPESVHEHLRNGLRMNLRVRSEYSVAEQQAAVDMTAPVEAFSKTNLHVQGVDEDDRLKYDGRYLYVAESATYGAGPSSGASEPARDALSLYRTDPAQASATPVMRYELGRDSDEALSLETLYILEATNGAGTEAVVALSNSRHPFGIGRWSTMAESDVPTNRTRVEVIDVQSPENPSVRWKLEVEGALFKSRKIGDVLYLVSHFEPRVEGLIHDPDSPAQRRQNERLIRTTPTAELFPHFAFNDDAKQPLVDAQDCYLPDTLNPQEGYSDLVTVSAFDLREQQLVSAVCVSARTDGMYMSPGSLYLGASGDIDGATKTGVHKFSIAEGRIDYRGSGLVSGHLNGSDRSFSMDEDRGYLRVVTTEWENGPEHRLHVLQESPDPARRTLEVVAQLPNEAQPQPIGKPGENLYAVRFLEKRAYLVTFRTIDPLYVIDLTNNEQPKVVGELEIPGVSNYLHPVDGGYLVSVGESADDGGWLGGIKVELFDVRDDQNPISVAAIRVGEEGSWSEALRNVRAFNVLRNGDDQLRFTLPVVRYKDYQRRDSGLHLFEVNQLTGAQATLTAVAPMTVTSVDTSDRDDAWSARYGARSRLHDDTVFYLQGNKVWARYWSDPESLKGPFRF